MENNIRAEFWEGVNREMAGHLKKAEELRKKAEKWRQDYDKWLGDTGNVKVSAQGGVGLEAGGELTVQVPKLPEDQKSTFDLIWEGLSKLPGAVYRGVKPHVGEMLEGLGFGFLAAGVLVLETALTVAIDVAKACVLAKLPGIVGKWAARSKYINGRTASFVGDLADAGTFYVPKALLWYYKDETLKEYGEKANRYDREIRWAKKLVMGDKLEKP